MHGVVVRERRPNDLALAEHALVEVLAGVAYVVIIGLYEKASVFVCVWEEEKNELCVCMCVKCVVVGA